tara:strand:+ start:290 stop:682 length:393 start_codon:yes stop_codon:yes gene_type:complete
MVKTNKGATPSNVANQGANVKRDYASRNKSSNVKVNELGTISLNHDLIDPVFEKLPAQVRYLIEIVSEVATDGTTCNIKDFNDAWDTKLIQSGKYVQDGVTIIRHYISPNQVRKELDNQNILQAGLIKLS